MDEPEYSWRYDARCQGKDETTLIFFPPRDKEQYRVLAAQAKSMCFGETGKNPCPVRAQCLWDAISREEPHGIWGGLSHRERNAFIRKYSKLKKLKKTTLTIQEYIFSEDN